MIAFGLQVNPAEVECPIRLEVSDPEFADDKYEIVPDLQIGAVVVRDVFDDDCLILTPELARAVANALLFSAGVVEAAQ